MATIIRYHTSGKLEIDCYYTNQLGEFNLDNQHQEQFQAFQKQYQDRSQFDNNQAELKALGEALYNWLNQRNWLDTIQSDLTQTPWIIEFQVNSRRISDEEANFLHLPWEILANNGQFLAADPLLQYSPLRRLGKFTETPAPSEYKPVLLFMAASPEGSTILDYEAEESIILEATGGLYQNDLDVLVEESGNLQQLSKELKDLNGTDILHLSCHGSSDNTLILETETGDKDEVNLQQLQQELSHHIPRLVFLSSCHSAKGQNTAEQDNTAQGLTVGLAQRGFPNVMGWADAVKDSDASRFASELYGQISKAQPLEQALAQSRFAALNPQQGEIIQDWHLARLYCSTQGGGVIAQGNNSRINYQASRGEKEFLGAKAQAGLEVASRDEFVGRRRPIQRILSTWRQGNNSVLIHGMGRQGKSSLAARLANRMQALTLVVIYGQYDAANIAREIVDQAGLAEISTHQLRQLKDNPQDLKQWIEPVLKQGILLVIDDLEQILQPNQEQRHHISTDHAAEQQSLLALLKAFAHHKQHSRLLITSRFTFDLFENNKNWGDTPYLCAEPLPAMTDDEQVKQYRRQQLKLQTEFSLPQRQQLLILAGGNPGLQALLTRLLAAKPAEEANHY